MEKFDVYGLGVNYNDSWLTNWKDVITTDHDYDGDFLIRLVTHKLRLMSKYYCEKAIQIKNGEFTTDNDVKDIIKSIDDCYYLGMKILNYNYGSKADELFAKHGSMIWLSTDFEDKKYTKWKKLTKKAEEDRQKDIDKFFSKMAKNINSWWV